MGNFCLFVLSILISSFLIVSKQPLGDYFFRGEICISLYRIILCAVLLFRIFRTRHAVPLIFGYRSLSGNLKFLPYLWQGLQYVFILFIGVGFYTDYFCLLLLITNIIFINKTKYYSIEDIYIQNIFFHFPFIAVGAHCSIDAATGIEPVFRNPYMLNSFFVSNALIMLSAGYEKIKSELWVEGKGATSFLSLPHLVKEKFHFLSTRFTTVFNVLGYLIMGAELLLILSTVHSVSLIIVLLILAGFAICLFIMVDISFIGQILLLNMLLFLSIVLVNFSPTIFWRITFPIQFEPSCIVALIVNIITAVVLFYYNFAKNTGLVKIQKFLSGINSPIGVFNEKHQLGFYIYHLTVDELPILEAFNVKGFPGKYQFWYPRYFQAAMYPVTDYCLGIYKFGENSSFKKEQIADLLYSGLLSIGKKQGTVALAVKKFDINDTILSYKEREWTIIGKGIHSIEGFEWIPREIPPEMKKTYRVI
jgi:hypothetical protein